MMRWLLVWLMLTMAVSAQPSTDWKTFSYLDDAFSVSAPKAFEVETGASPSGLVMRYYSLDRGHNSGWMIVTTRRSPQDHREPQQVLDEACEGGARAVGGQVVSKEPLKLGPYPGLATRVSTSGYDISVHYFVALGRIYQLIATTQNGAPGMAETQRFFDSFKVLTP